MENFPCPICNETHQTLARYPLSVCHACLQTYRTRDKNGDIKDFYNIDIYGGIRAFVNGQETTDYSCYVNNIKCMGGEARFGGIVISRYYENNQVPQHLKST